MKKLLVCVMFALMAFSVASFAQPGSANFEQVKKMYKDSLQLTDAQSDSIVAVIKRFQPQFNAVFMDKSISAADKSVKVEAINAGMTARYKAILTDGQFAKYQAMMARRRAQMRNHGAVNSQ